MNDTTRWCSCGADHGIRAIDEGDGLIAIHFVVTPMPISFRLKYAWQLFRSGSFSDIVLNKEDCREFGEDLVAMGMEE